MEEIKEKLRAFIQEKFEIDDDPDFTDDVHLFNEGFVDSFGAVEIIHFIEQTYNIEITQKDITLYPMNTIEEIAEVVENKCICKYSSYSICFVAACHSDCMLYTYNIYFCTNTETAEKNTAVFLRTVQYFVYSAVFLRTNDGVFPATSCNNYICGNSVSYAKSG